MESNIIKLDINSSFKYNIICNYSDENVSNDNIQRKENFINNGKIPEKDKFQKYSVDTNVTSNNEKMKEQNIINFDNPKFHEYLNSKNGELIFLVHKRDHSIDKLETNNESNKSVIYRKHDRNEKDNIVTKIQIHYRNFLISFINEIIIKILVEDYYNTKELEKIKNLKEYLFKDIDQHFKSNIKKEYMKFAESNKIKDIISPSVLQCKKYQIENKNQKIIENVLSLNIYYNNKRNINLSEGNSNISLEISNNIKLFNNLTNKYIDDEKYISNLKKFAELNFCKNVTKI
jgi:hypothetical protein